ncbi:MAG: hypothetical protein FWE31_05810, partial [Firmicutes bacterium]|nr:hypothetical protein [Bacillota bacterium]
MIKEKLLEGARKLAEIVGITLGPRGRNVVLDRDGHPLITNDGVTIAREVKLHCPIEFMGAKIILQASSQTNQRAGDGTTSSIILAHEILRRGFEEVHSGTSPILLNDELLSLLPKIEALIKDIAIPLTNDKIQAIATNSSASDQLGQLVTQAFNIVGLDGIVTLEENNLGHTTLTHSDGAQFPLALAHPNFITDHKTLSSTLVSPHLKILDTPAKDLNALVPMLEHALETNTSLAIIAPDFSPDTLNLLLANRTRVRILPLKLNTHPSQHYTTLGDLKSISITKLTADMNSTRIHFRHENESEASVSFSARIETIKAQINSSTDDFEKYTL